MAPKRVDANQKEIVEALRGVGATVLHLHEVGKGCPDLLIGYRGKNFLFEIKDGTKPPSKRKLTKQEAEFFETWQGEAWVVTSVEDALDVLTKF